MTDANRVLNSDSMVQPKATHGSSFSHEIRKELEALGRTIQNVRNKFCREYSQVDSAVALSIQEHKESVNKHKEVIKRLEDTYMQLEDKDLNKKKMSEEQEEAISKLRKTIEMVREETDVLLRQKELLEKETDNILAKNQREREELEKEEKSTSQTAEELEKMTSLFRDCLGLSMKKISGNRLQFVFTNIDQKEPTRPFIVCVKVKEDRSYEVTDCDPSVPELPAMISRLNATNNFRSFIISLRKSFKLVT